MQGSTIIACTGFHRSATSLTAQLLARAGLPMGLRLMPAHVSNPDGHFEDAELVTVHDRLLREAGTSWQFHDEAALPSVGAVSERLVEYLQRRDSVHPTGWGVKDPRLCLFLPHWDAVLGARGRYLIVIRHWSAAVDSLLRRHSRELAFNPLMGEPGRETNLSFWWSPPLAARMWLAYCRRLVEFVAGHPDRAIVVPHAALVSGFPLIDHLNRRWGLQLDAPRSATIKPELLHDQAAASLQALYSPPLQAELNAVWRNLLALVPEEGLDMLGNRAAIESPSWRREAGANIATAVASQLSGRWQVTKVVSAPEGERVPPAVPWCKDRLLPWLRGAHGIGREEVRLVADWLMRHSPDDADLWFALSAQALRYQLTADAEDALLRAIAAGLTMPMAWMMLGQVHEIEGRWARAEYYFRQAQVRNPKNPMFRVALSRVLQATGRVDEAMNELKAAIKLKAEPIAVSALVQLFAEHERVAEALALLDQLGNSAPEHLEHWGRLRAILLLPVDRHAADLILRKEVRDRLLSQRLHESLTHVLRDVDCAEAFNDLLRRILDHWSEVLSGEDLTAGLQ